MFFNFLRCESFVSSVELMQLKQSRVCVVAMDIHESVQVLKAFGVPVDMVFIDAEKKRNPLISLIKNIRATFPDAVIVGDDYIFPTVRDALEVIRRQGNEVIAREESYMIIPTHDQTQRAETESIMRSVFFNIDQRVSVVTGAIKDMINKSRDIVGLEKLLFDPRFQLFKAFDNGQITMAHVFMSHAMKFLRSSDQGEYSKALRHLATRVVESATDVTLTEGLLSIFDFVTHSISFQ